MDGYAILEYARREGRPAALATLLRAEGHSYRKAGAMMLLPAAGGRLGSISPGCLEDDLEERAVRLAATGEPELVSYDLRPEEDAVWGEEIGCGGRLRIFLEPLDEAALSGLAEAKRQVDAGARLEWTRRLAGRRIEYGWRRLERAGAGGAIAGRESGGDDATGGAPAAESAGEGGRLFSTLFEPRPRLFLFGAGDASLPIAKLASGVGYRVAVGDWRPSLCHEARFPGAECAAGDAGTIMRTLRLGAADAMLVCSHHLRRDREMLELLLAMRPVPAYIGAIGSARRIAALFDGRAATAGVRAPAGVAIGAEGPEEIAVSVVSELIAERARMRKSEGGSVLVHRGDLFGGGEELPHGSAQAELGACAR